MKTAKTTVLAIGVRLEETQAYLQSMGVQSLELHRGDPPSLKQGRPTLHGYASLRFDSEEVLTASVEEREVRRVVTALQRNAQAAVFTFPEDLREYAPPVIEPGANLKTRLKTIEKSIARTYRELKETGEVGHLVSPAAHWLLENAHALRAHVSGIREAFSRELLGGVPRDATGLPDVMVVAELLVGSLDGVITESKILEAIGRHQTEATLKINELWLIPALIRLALVEYLARQGELVTFSQHLREAAYFWANRLAAASRAGETEYHAVLAFLKRERVVSQPYFLISVAEQLQDEGRALSGFRLIVEAVAGKALPELVSREHQSEALQGVAIANAFNSLRALSGVDFVSVFEQTSRAEQELRRDPGQVYARSDADTRNQGRRAVQDVARDCGKPEWEVARTAVEMAAVSEAGRPATQVLHYLIDEGRPALEQRLGARVGWQSRLERGIRRNATPLYLLSIAVVTLAFSLLAIGMTLEFNAHQSWILLPLWFLALFPLGELAIQIVNMLVISIFRASSLPRMDFKDGIPPEHATLVVVPMMLTSQAAVKDELEKLEIRFLANPGPHVCFALLSDFVDAAQRDEPEDAALLAALRSGVEALNAKYSGARFLAFHRGRTWSQSEQRWIGAERKRGKLEALNAFLRGRGDPSLLVAGALSQPVRYVITLDADTQLPPTSARRLIETIAHPLNRAVLDPVTKVRQRGFSIIQPRVSISLPGATATRFTRIIGDPHGTDPYCRIVSDSQQDLFGHAIFHGKAIYDVDAFSACLENRFPPETILSHDLIEGAHCGVGLATDIELFESMPLDYASFSRRQHRWIRGDWQIAPWIRGKVPSGPASGWVANPLTLINRWRILDNLRRSLVPAASVALLLFGWFLSATPAVWTTVLVLAVAIPALATWLDRLALRIQGSVSGGRGGWDELVRVLISLFFLPHQAWLALDAIARAGYRMIVSRRHLLEWQTAESAGQAAVTHASAAMRHLVIIAAGSAAMAVWQALMQHGSAIPLLICWSAAPLLMHWLSSRVEPELQDELDNRDRASLRQMARRTWRYFDELVGPQNNWLPPDNSQLALRIEVAERTSPTNIGLWLNSAQAAHDFGYLTGDDLCARCTASLATIERMEKHQGHLLNWYNTSTLEPLPPRYVSTVDSGNFIASLWVLEQGCEEILHAEPLKARLVWRGLADTLAILREAAGRDASAAFELRALRRVLRAEPTREDLPNKARLVAMLADRIRASLGTGDEEITYWADRLNREAAAWITAIERYGAWLEVLVRPSDATLRRWGGEWPALRRIALTWRPSLEELAAEAPSPVDQMIVRRERDGVDAALASWLDDLKAEFIRSRRYARQSAKDWRELAARTHQVAQGINMGILFDQRRKLFGIGYATGGGPVEFSSHYDLLASECRIASLVSIARGDVPLEHWMRLGRPRTPSSNGPTLLSWSGTMFEYLMPLLFVRMYPNSLLEHACRDAVLQQIQHGEQSSLPWGVSESAYSAIDSGGTYQYQAFGIPALSLKPIPEEESVVAPYATALALQVNPRAAVKNLAALKELGLAGPMGFYEAIDFTRQPTPDGERGVIIYCYMAHHQGMTMLAICNLLEDGAMQRRFQRDLRIRAIESLLFERIPNSPLTAADDSREMAPLPARAVENPPERVWTEQTPVPRVQLLGNGRYSVMVTNSGAGYSRWGEIDISRWRSDSACDSWGSFLLVRDVKASAIWSATYQPLGGQLGSYSAQFTADHAEFHRQVTEIETNLQIAVSPDDDVEIRRLSITNGSSRQRALDITSFFEVALATHGADRAHPAYAKMFVQTECPERGLLVATRRKRSPEEAPVWAAHMLVGSVGAVSFETDREIFLGRANTLEFADAHGRNLTNSAGAVVDPVFSLRCRVTLNPGCREEITFLTLAAHSREALMSLAGKYRRPGATQQLLELVWNRAQLDFRYLRIGPEDAHRFQHLGSAMLFPDPNLRARADRISRDRLGQSNLWATGISGDLPMLTVAIADTRGLGLLRESLLAHRYLRLRGLRFDLVILNQEPVSYDRPLHNGIRTQVDALAAEAGTEQPGGVYVRDWHSLAEDAGNQILAASHVVLRGSRGSLSQHLGSAPERALPRISVSPVQEEPSFPLPFLELPYFNGLGGFTTDGREYAIYLPPGRNTPSPWSNVMAHETFGTLVTESGLGFTWCGNSQANRLTPWHNDPVSDPQSEAIYLRDEDSGRRWTTTALPIREQDAYRARHGQGYTVFEHNSHAIRQELTVFVPIGRDGVGQNVKLYRLRLRNDSSRERRLTATFFAELTLGSQREEQQLRVSTSHDAVSGAVLANQWWSGSRAGECVFVTSSPKPASFSGDRLQFLGRNRSIAKPDALDRVRLDNRCGPGLDPAGAVQVVIRMAAGAQAEVTFMLGEAESLDACRTLVDRFQNPAMVDAALTDTKEWWDAALSQITVKTPVLSVDLLVNRWLLYQSLSCRFWGRSALYQSGGAIGFRDQLQDCLALLYAFPKLARRHLLIAASRQFEQGDVQHWWHPDSGLGVRTRCSDDMLWLPYAVSQYVEVTGDTGVLDEMIEFLAAPELRPGEHEKMLVPAVAETSGSLREHCLRAISRASEVGRHGMPLMGNGDWNDGMNLVGAAGKGESIWLAWFLCAVYGPFAHLLEATGSPELAIGLRRQSAEIAAAVERSGWDGAWYLRAYFDSGERMGSGQNPEAKIDSIAQSWSVISAAAHPERSRIALNSARDWLVDEENKIVKLFTPPFDNSSPHPGYIMGYPPGLRENGGQYTHGSLWLGMAFARLGLGDEAVRLLHLMNPIEQTRTAPDVARYRGEPYAVAADVSAAPNRLGRSGWTWYTGSAAWMYRIWVEELLGLQVRGDVLSVSPVLPREWEGFEFTYRVGQAVYSVSVKVDGSDGAAAQLEGDFTGKNGGIHLIDDGRTHKIRMTFPRVTKRELSPSEPPGLGTFVVAPGPEIVR